MRNFAGKHRGVLPILVVLAASCGGNDAKEATPDDSTTNIVTTACDACSGDCETLTATINDRTHTTDTVVYSEQPPVGGPHNPCWLPWAIYTSEPQTERWVHNLEHGGVALLYSCPAGCDADIATLTTFFQSLPQGRAVMLPYAEMDAHFAIVAWGVSESMGCVDTSALQAFYDAHTAQSPENATAEPPSSCPPP